MHINKDTWASVQALLSVPSNCVSLPVAKDAGFWHIGIHIHQGSADGPQSLAIEVSHPGALDSNYRMPSLLSYLHTTPRRSIGAPEMCQRCLKVLIILHRLTAHHSLAVEVSNRTMWAWCMLLQTSAKRAVGSAKHVMECLACC